MNYIGIDPGASGGLALVSDSSTYPQAVKMPATERDIVDVLEAWKEAEADVGLRAALEHVWSTPGQGGAFKFGQSVGTLRGILTALRIPFDPVLPRTWQLVEGVAYKKGLTDTEKKNITKRRAQQIFPELTITHATADALLMADYCRRMHRGEAATHGKTKSARQSSRRRA